MARPGKYPDELREHAEHEVLHWIGFYNEGRLHEALGDLLPTDTS